MARLRKLKYCPACGSALNFDYGQGIIYWAIRWRCTNSMCDLASHWRPLHGWNEYYQPNIKTLLIETLKEILWEKTLAEAEFCQAMRELGKVWLPIWGFRCNWQPYITNLDEKG